MTTRGALLAAAGALAVAAWAACGTTPPTPEPPVVCEEPPAARAGRGSHQGLQCGPTLDFTPINRYEGEIASIQEREDAVVLIAGSCTGTLIAAAAGPVVLTAGHCVGLGARVVVAFNHEDEPDGDPLVTEGTVIEQSTTPDYALVQLDALPAVTPTLLTSRSGDLLAIIQHPRGRPKVIAEGDFLDACSGQLYYTDLDTLVGSSGAGVLTRGGSLVGVHTDGDCGEDGGGANRGWTAAAIVDASPYLESTDIADR
jgi:hypothetical protein